MAAHSQVSGGGCVAGKLMMPSCLTAIGIATVTMQFHFTAPPPVLCSPMCCSPRRNQRAKEMLRAGCGLPVERLCKRLRVQRCQREHIVDGGGCLHSQRRPMDPLTAAPLLPPTCPQCAPVPHCLPGEQTGLAGTPPCCCQKCTDGFVPECNDFTAPTDCDTESCGCTCTSGSEPC